MLLYSSRLRLFDFETYNFHNTFPVTIHWEAAFQNGDQTIKKDELQQWKDDSDESREAEDRNTQKNPGLPLPLLFLFLVAREGWLSLCLGIL